MENRYVFREVLSEIKELRMRREMSLQKKRSGALKGAAAH